MNPQNNSDLMIAILRTLLPFVLLISACSNLSGDVPAVPPKTFNSERGPAADCPPDPVLSDPDSLKAVPHLPDPFLFFSDKPVETMDQWRCRRAEIGTLAQQAELGEKPGVPETVSGLFDGDSLHVQIDHHGESITFSSEVILPSVGQAPFPAIIGIGRSFLDNSQLDSLGVAIINFPNDLLAGQQGPQSRGQGLFYELHGRDHSAGALMAWAWGVSRVIDLLQEITSPINPERIGVTGCSRNGKGALVAGAFDERIALTLPQESGAGGAASWRISDAMLKDGKEVQTLRQIVDENVWFRESFREFSDSAERLPYDHHALMGMTAPRGLLVLEHSGIEWLGPESTYGASLAARQIWTAMGVPERLGVSLAGEHNHCQLPDSQKPHVAAFVESFLLETQELMQPITETDRQIPYDADRWTPWTPPVLQ